MKYINTLDDLKEFVHNYGYSQGVEEQVFDLLKIAYVIGKMEVLKEEITKANEKIKDNN